MRLPSTRYDSEGPRKLTDVDGTLYFADYDGSKRNALSLWTSDGTAEGTVQISGPDPASTPELEVYDMVGAAGALYLTAGTPYASAATLWRGSRSDVPGTGITAGPDAGTVLAERSATFEFAGTADVTAGFECSLDRATYERCASPVTYSDSELPNGSRSFAVRAVNDAGVADATPATRSFVVAWNYFGVSSRFKRVVEDGAVKARVFVPGPGRLELARTRLVKPVGLDVDKDGRTIVRVEPTRSGLRKLRQDRRASKRGRVARCRSRRRSPTPRSTAHRTPWGSGSSSR